MTDDALPYRNIFDLFDGGDGCMNAQELGSAMRALGMTPS